LALGKEGGLGGDERGGVDRGRGGEGLTTLTRKVVRVEFKVKGQSGVQMNIRRGKNV